MKMFKWILVFLGFLTLGACAMQETKVADYLKKNPKLVFDVIEENPEQFIEVVNRAAQKARSSQYTKQEAEMKQQQEQQVKNPLKPAMDESTKLYGPSQAPIVIVEYADFQCPACRMAHATLKQVKKKYGDRVQVHFKHMPLDFHRMAMPAAKYFEALKQESPEKAEKFYDLIFEQQDQMTSEEFLKRSLKQIGAPVAKVVNQLESEKVRKTVERDMLEFQNFGFTGTPVIVVNGVALHGAQPLAEIDRVIELTAASKN